MRAHQYVKVRIDGTSESHDGRDLLRGWSGDHEPSGSFDAGAVEDFFLRRISVDCAVTVVGYLTNRIVVGLDDDRFDSPFAQQPSERPSDRSVSDDNCAVSR